MTNKVFFIARYEFEIPLLELQLKEKGTFDDEVKVISKAAYQAEQTMYDDGVFYEGWIVIKDLELDKKNALLLDFTDNLRKFGGLANPIWEYMGSTKRKIGKPVKVCPACEEVITIGHESCPACDYIFEKEEVVRELKHTAEADFNSDIEKDGSVKYVTVNNVLHYKHVSKNNNENFRIEYQWGKSGSSVSEYIPFGGKLKWQKAKCYEFIEPRASLMPESIDEALELCKTWKVPQVLRIKRQKANPKYWEVDAVERWVKHEAD